jgi:hypothetical protein
MPPMQETHTATRRPAVPTLILAGLIVVLGALAALVLLDAKLVEEGHLLPWAGDHVRRYELLGVKFYVDDETRPSFDLTTSWSMLALGSVALLGAILEARTHGRTKAWQFLLIATIGGLWVGMDEALGFHETIGHNLGFLTDVPGVDRPDDLVIGLYVVIAFVLAYVFRDVLATSRPARLMFFAALGFAVASAVLDLLAAPDALEEGMEALATLTALGAFTALTADIVVPRAERG